MLHREDATVDANIDINLWITGYGESSRKSETMTDVERRR